MATVTLTEYNRRPSRIARLARHEDVIVTDRGVPVLEIRRIGPATSRRDALIASGVITRPAHRRQGTLPTPTTSPGVARSILDEWDAERDREY